MKQSCSYFVFEYKYSKLSLLYLEKLSFIWNLLSLKLPCPSFTLMYHSYFLNFFVHFRSKNFIFFFTENPLVSKSGFWNIRVISVVFLNLATWKYWWKIFQIFFFSIWYFLLKECFRVKENLFMYVCLEIMQILIMNDAKSAFYVWILRLIFLQYF